MRATVRTLLRVVLAAALVGLVLWKYPISGHAVLATLRGMNVALLILVLALLFNQYVVSSQRWGAILRSHGIRIPLATLVRSYMVSTLASSFLPSSYLGDVVRIAHIGRASGKTFETASAVVLERLMGLVALASLGLVAGLWVGTSHHDPAFLRIAPVFAAVVVTVALAFVPGVVDLMRTLAAKLPAAGARRLGLRIADTIVQYRRDRRLLGTVLLWSFVFQVAACHIVFFEARALGLHVPYLYFYAFVPAVYVLEALPISVGGLGVREGALIFFLGRVGIAPSQAVTLGLVMMACRYLVLTSGVLVVVLVGSRGGPVPTVATPVPPGPPVRP